MQTICLIEHRLATDRQTDGRSQHSDALAQRRAVKIRRVLQRVNIKQQDGRQNVHLAQIAKPRL